MGNTKLPYWETYYCLPPRLPRLNERGGVKVMKDDNQQDKKLTSDPAIKKRPIIQDSDLQIQTPSLHKKDSKNSFKAVHTHFVPEPAVFGQKELNLAMEEAKTAFESMKEIQDQLSQAYTDLIKPDTKK